jgi:hypothetical protein
VLAKALSLHCCCCQAAIKTINQNVSVFTVGEMLMGDPFRWATDYIAHWVKDGAVGSAFNYPMVSTMRRTLRVSAGCTADWTTLSAACWFGTRCLLLRRCLSSGSLLVALLTWAVPQKRRRHKSSK